MSKLLSMSNINQAIENLADTLSDCVVYAKPLHHVNIVAKEQRKFKPRRVATKKVYAN